MLRELASREASGELVAAHADMEVHVYFHQGRVAWATSSVEPQAFLRHLVEVHGADREGLKEVIEECRRARKRFGQTLIEWGLASTDQVRDSLRHQITGALGTLEQIPRGSALFLPKALSYTDDFTFAIDELLPETEADPPPVASADTARAAELVDAFLRGCPDASWAVAMPPGVRDGLALDQADASIELLASLLGVVGDAETLTLRSISGAVTGRATGGGLWLFAGVPAAVGLGLPTAVLAHLVGNREQEHREVRSGEVSRWTDPALVDSIDPLISAVETADELASALVVGAGRYAGAVRGAGDPPAAAVAANRLVSALDLSLAGCLPNSDSVVTSLRYERLSLHVREGGADYFGVALGDDSSRSLWLELAAGTPAGMGWALLSALARQIRSS